jgi:hypothetical protein
MLGALLVSFASVVGDTAPTLGFYSALRSADLISTEWALNQEAQEGNPLAQTLTNRALLHTGAAIACTLVDKKLEKHKALRWGWRLLNIGVAGYITVNNLNKGREAQMYRRLNGNGTR